MAWNEPGGGRGGNQDPWGGRGGNKNDGPPDLDEVIKKLADKLGGIFGGSGNNGGSAGSLGGGAMLILIPVVLAVLYVIVGFYKVEQAEEAVVLRFGKYLETASAGLHWRPPLVDSVTVVGVMEVNKQSVSATMITKDVNIVDIELEVQYRISNPFDYTLKVVDPTEILRDATESALRQVVGGVDMEQVISEGRALLSGEVLPLLQDHLDLYEVGLLVVSVNVVEAQPPAEVRAAFIDVIKAPKDKVKLINEAQAYANQIVPEARGLAQQVLQEAMAYKLATVAEARGEAERFDLLYAEYKKAPKVTRTRLYLDAMEQVYSSTTKVLVDVKDGGSLLYLPLDKLPTAAAAAVAPSIHGSNGAGSGAQPKHAVDRLRQRVRGGQ